jgi:holo-[acyl-carrier protein] synthase
MITGCGVDVLELAKFDRFLRAHAERVREVVFTPKEWDAQRSTPEGRLRYFASRFAAKEAVIKACGAGSGVVYEWNEIEVLGEHALTICLHGRLAAHAEGVGIRRLTGSCTVSKKYAIACIIGE